ncbi:Esterase [Apiospora rasikravindrae]|uniref:Esterase n=1 Tax=Apiospora rasikravindrae TaxID=990691 RepID=A0ABR1TFV3_9PEZI
MAEQKPKGGVTKTAKARLELLWTVLPKIPSVIRVVLLHVLKMSEPSRYLDLRENVIVAFLRSLLDQPKPQPISKTQRMTLRDPGIKGRIWVSKVSAQVPPEESIRDVLLAAIDSSKGQFVVADGICRVPDIIPVEAEWTGYRAHASPSSELPAIPEQQKYAEMMKECSSDVTILYFHGGAYYLMDPASHRPTTKRLAKMTGGRVYSVRYRLAPQDPFPSALLDAFVSYMTLLYPPPGAVHAAVDASKIVFSGDSAGGNLSLALLQTILEIRRRGLKVTWFGHEREVPLPAAVAANSPWLDIVQSMPSWMTNQKMRSGLPNHHGNTFFIDDDFLLHPLACLHLNASWEGAPPIYVCCGWECLADEDKWFVSKLVKDGVAVVFEEYEAMPHVFAAILEKAPQSARCFDGWAKFISQACGSPQEIRSSFTTIKAKTMKEVDINVKNLSPFTEEDLRKFAFDRVGRKSSFPNTPAKL